MAIPKKRATNNMPAVEPAKPAGLPSLSELPAIEPKESLPQDEEFVTVVEEYVPEDDNFDTVEIEDEELVDETQLPDPGIKGFIDDPHDNELIHDDEPTEEEKTKFINKKKKKIIPIGGEKASHQKKEKVRKKVKASDFDERKNKLTMTKVIRLLCMIGLIIVFALGIKNTWFPENLYSKRDIEGIAQSAVGMTGFPTERGQAFAEDFIHSYLTYDSSSKEMNEYINYFYGDSAGSTKFREISVDTVQEVLISPKVFETIPVNNNTETYKLSAFVTDIDGSQITDKKVSARWVSFAVSVYYDSNKNTLAITSDSPMAIPKYELQSSGNIPKEYYLGNGQANEEVLPLINPVIDGYVEAFLKSSVTSWEAIKPYVPANPNIDLYSGFGGAVRLNGNPTEAIKRVAYNTDNENEFKVDLSVSLVDNHTMANGKQIKYTTRYVATIQRTEDNKYLVVGFKPYVYVPNMS